MAGSCSAGAFKDLRLEPSDSTSIGISWLCAILFSPSNNSNDSPLVRLSPPSVPVTRVIPSGIPSSKGARSSRPWTTTCRFISSICSTPKWVLAVTSTGPGIWLASRNIVVVFPPAPTRARRRVLSGLSASINFICAIIPENLPLCYLLRHN